MKAGRGTPRPACFAFGGYFLEVSVLGFLGTLAFLSTLTSTRYGGRPRALPCRGRDRRCCRPQSTAMRGLLQPEGWTPDARRRRGLLSSGRPGVRGCGLVVPRPACA